MAGTPTIPDVHFARLSRNGRSLSVSIPAEIRQALGWYQGTVLELWIQDGRLLLSQAVANRHLLPGPGPDSPAGGGTAGKDPR